MKEKPLSAEEMVLYAWVGKDDAIDAPRTEEFGLKQGVVPAGNIPLVACKEEKMLSQDLINQMMVLMQVTGIPRQLVKFKFEKVILEIP
jgi:hypothetical protein